MNTRIRMVERAVDQERTRQKESSLFYRGHYKPFAAVEINKNRLHAWELLFTNQRKVGTLKNIYRHDFGRFYQKPSDISKR